MTFEPDTIKAVAALLLGEPNAQLSKEKELRYGTHGSLAIDTDKNTFFDHESNEGGGVLDLILRHDGIATRSQAVDWLKEHGIALPAANGLQARMAQRRKEAMAARAAEKTVTDRVESTVTATAKKPVKARVIATYDYRAEDGSLLFQVQRFEPKKFVQRRPAGDGWEYKVQGTRQVPYRLPELVAAPLSSAIYIVEGEKDADRLAALGLVATCNAGGAGKWKSCHSEHLKDRTVILIPDNDDAGREHVQKVAKSLKGIAAHIRIMELPGLPEKGDVSDWLDAGGTREQLTSTPTVSPAKEQDAGDDDDEEKKRSQTDMLVEFASIHFELLHDKNGDVYARDNLTGEVRRLGGRQFKDRLIAGFYKQKEVAVRDQSLREALGTLQALGRYNGEPQAVHVRCAAHGGKYYLDLCEPGNSRAIELAAGHWRIVDTPPVLFVRGEAMQPLPTPVKGGSLARLWDTANVPENLRILVVAWLIDSMRPDTPYPGLELVGEQGSGKSTAAEALRRVIDPSSCNLRGAPKTVEDIFVAAGQNHVVAYENVSHLPGPMQDALCILSTGGGYSKRMLYSNDDEHVINVRRPWMLNGISIAVTQQDAVDRVISVECPVIEERQSSSRQWDEFESALPGILGGLLDTASKALGVLPSMKLPPADRPRLVEFALLGMAVARSAGRDSAEFMDKFKELRAETVARTLDASPVAAAVVDMIEADPAGITQPVKAILNRLERYKPTGADAWPRSPKGLGDALRRAAPALRQMGIECKCLGKGSGGVVRWVIQKKVQDTKSQMSQVPTFEDFDGPENAGHGTSGTLQGQVSSGAEVEL
jgi:energy-coupling factor transporter ATP-binding protein EcfA2